MRISFIIEGLKLAKIDNYEIILIDCSDECRTSRLIKDRAQPELATKEMKNWANLLREEARNLKLRVLDTTNKSIDESVSCVEGLLK